MTPVQPAKTRQGGAEGTQSASSDPLSLRSLRVGDECVVTDGRGRRYAIIEEAGNGYVRLGSTIFDARTGRSVFAVDDAGHAHAYTIAMDALIRARKEVVRAVHVADDTKLLAIHDALKAAGLL